MTRSRRRHQIDVEVAREGRRWTCLGRLSAASAIAAIAEQIALHVALPAERCTATVMLSDDARVGALNGEWRGKAKPTNVLSFPAAREPGTKGSDDVFLGDVILAQETLVREAAEQGIATSDHFRHLVLHGLLHLLGYDHESDRDALMMETLETRILAALGVADPYAGSDPVAASAGNTRKGNVRKARQR